MTVDPRTPVIVGVAQSLRAPTEPSEEPNPAQHLADVARSAYRDAGLTVGNCPPDWVAVTRTVPDSFGLGEQNWGYQNIAGSAVHELGVSPDRLTYPEVGGHTPQWMINLFAEAITDGTHEACLIVGGESSRTALLARRSGTELAWQDPAPAADLMVPEVVGDGRRATSKTEFKHGLFTAVGLYSLYENALAARDGSTSQAHAASMGALMEPFSARGAANPFGAATAAMSAEELVSSGPANPMISWPYPKYLCANNSTDQYAAVLMMSTAEADRRGVPDHRRIYLRGSADTEETLYITQRPDFVASEAIRAGAAAALTQAEIGVEQIEAFDLYSCFPAVVRISAEAIGVAVDDPRGLTLTGGLPYFGGPGNNYSTHGIAAMVNLLRGQAPPDAAGTGRFGLVHANGGALTKHSIGVYGNRPPRRLMRRVDPAAYQPESVDHEVVDLPGEPGVRVEATIETFTVSYHRNRPTRGILVVRLADGRRCLAVMFDDAWLAELTAKSPVGRHVVVIAGTPVNQAEFPDVRPASADEPPAVLVEVRGRVAVVTINRPAARNAVNAAVAMGLEKAVRTVEEDPRIRAAVLTSAGDKAFSAGVDLADVAAGRSAEISRPGSGFAGFVQVPRRKPWVAAVGAPALGGGLELCLACDLIIAADDAELGLPEVKRGLVAGAGGLIRLPRVIPRAIAYEMILTGEPLTAARALETGLVNRVVPAAQVLETAVAMAAVIADNAPLSVTGSLEIARETADRPEEQMWPINNQVAGRVMRSQDAAEGPRAFLEKRSPNWQGR